MDGVSWSTTRAPESFSRSRTTADTLSRLASFIARADTSKQHTRSQNQRQRTSPLLPADVCPECGKVFPSAEDLLHHQELEHSLPKPHRCPSCGQEFSLKSSLQLHQCARDFPMCELCRGESRLGSPCSACAARALEPGRPQDKSLHRQPHLLDASPYACAPCGRGFSQKQALLHHQQAGCSEPQSPSDTADAGSLPDDSPPASEGDSARSDCSDTPGPSSGGRSVIMCQFCPRTFRTEAGLQRHEETSHGEDWLGAPQGQKTKAECTGGEVRKGANSGTSREPNTRENPQTKLLSCRSCDMVFCSTAKLYVHRKEKHSRDKNMRREPRPVIITRRRRRDAYPCQVCGKVFFHHLSLRAHYRQHTASGFPGIKNKSQTVGSSAKDCKSTENRPNKLKSSLGGKTVKAGAGRSREGPRVESRFSHAGRWKEVPEVEVEEEDEEEEEEEEETEFPCPSCAEVFPLQSQLKEHMELHQSSVKRRQCSVCAHEMDTCKWPGSKRQRLYHCVPCHQGFSALDSFLEHCQEHLRVRVEEDSITEGYAQQQARKA